MVFFDDDDDTLQNEALQLIRSDDPDLKLQATKQIMPLAKYAHRFKQALSGSIEPLLSMLRVDSPESHCESAFLALGSLANNHKKNKIKIVKASALPPIISYLQSQSLLHESASKLLCSLSAYATNKSVIGSSGAIPLLVKILKHGSLRSKDNAVSTLFNLSIDPSNFNVILGTNPIPHVINLLKTDNKSSKQTECSALIKSLVGFDEGRMALTSEEGGMLAVVEVIKSGSSQSRKHAVQVLLTMCDSDRCKYRELIVQKGVISGLSRHIFLVKQVCNSQVEEILLLLKDVVHQTILQSNDLDLKLQVTIEIGQLIMNFRRELSSLIEPLVSMFQIDFPESHHKAALGILVSLAYHNEENRFKIVEAGALEPIIRVLQSESLLEVLATKLLCFLSASAINKPVIGSSGAIPLLVEILRDGFPQSKINAISALFNLSKNPINLNIILGTNPIPPIVNLLKTSKKLSTPTERCYALIESLLGFDEGRTMLTSEEGGILAVVEVFKFGSPQSQEHALGVLLTICKSDRYNCEELLLGGDIILVLVKFTIEGTPKTKLKAQILFLLLSRVPRVTSYRQNDTCEQVHHGFHFVTIDYVEGSKELGLFITSEEDGGISLLHRIGPDDGY